MRNLLFVLMCVGSTFLQAQSLTEVNLSSYSWLPIDEKDKLLCFYNSSINTDVYSYRYTKDEEDDFQDQDDKVIYRHCGVDLPNNEIGSVITFTLTNDHSKPLTTKYKIAQVTKSGKEKEDWYTNDVYWGYDIRIDHIDGSSSWYTQIIENGSKINSKGTSTWERSPQTNTWSQSPVDISSVDVSVIFNAKKNRASVNGVVYNNVKNIGRVNLKVGSAARLRVSNFTMKVGQIESSKWNNKNIRENIDTNNDGLCGLYLVDELTLGVVKVEDEKYQILYVDGLDENSIEEPGDLYATGEMTAIPGIVAFRTAKKNLVFYMAVDGTTMRWAKKPGGCFANDAEVYLKMYPSSSNTTISSTSPIASSPSDANDEGYTSQGSGIILSKNGVVATNFHVVQGAKKYDIIVKDGNSVKTYHCELLASDKVNDLALLKVNDNKFTSFSDIPYSIKTKQSDVGTKCYAYGYPMEQILGSEVKVTDGIISSKTGWDGDIVNYQISVAITHGNSGGPLFDDNGNLIGITSSGVNAEVAQNTNYAIKASYLRNIIDSAPIDIDIPNGTTAKDKSLVDQVKILSPFVVCVKVK